MNEMLRNGVRSALILLAFSIAFTAMMAGTYGLTREIVEKNEADAKAQQLAQVLPAGSFDNALNQSGRIQPGKSDGSQYFLASKDGRQVAAVFEAAAPDGYAGKISMLIGVSRDGSLLGVRVVAHKETPGLGDYIDAAKSDWIRMFEGKSLQDPLLARWKVKKDGGAFDYTAGATISPRAVVKAVKNTLEYVQANRAALFTGE